MKTIGIITNAAPDSGVGQRAYEVSRRMPSSNEYAIELVSLDTLRTIRPLPGVLGSKSITWLRLAKYLPEFNLYDLSNQTLSFIAKKRHPSVITVHDLIELTDPQDARASLLNRYLLSGIARADHIVSVSEYTKRVMEEHLNIQSDRIRVIPNGVHEAYMKLKHFRDTIAYRQLAEDLGLTGRNPIILHVGSEHPRKNVDTVLRVISILKKQYPDVLLVKIGEPGFRAGRLKTLELIDKLQLRSNVKLLGTIPRERVNEIYNVADVLLFPSLLEGFGMPPLEAMAAGCPVVCSNTTSLPEVVGDGAVMHDPLDAEAFAASIIHIVSNESFRSHLIERGHARTSQFSWDAAARDMMTVYRELV